MDYLLNILILICIYVILTASLDLLVGHTGLLSISHSAFYGIGAYTTALMAVNYDTPFPIILLMSMVVALITSLIVSLPSLRLQGDYFVIATFGFQMIIFSLFNNWPELTRGPAGLPDIPLPSIYKWTIQSSFSFFTLIAPIAFFTYAVMRRITLSPFGRVLHAIREDEGLAQSFGKNTWLYKVLAFSVSAAFAALAGCIYAYYMRIVDPSSFTVMESILVISMVIIGGAGSRWGPVVGAVILVVFPEILRFIGLPPSAAANVRQIFYGLLLVITMSVRPTGLLCGYSFGR